MKLVGLMSLTDDQQEIRKIFEQSHIQIYSELDIHGHTADSLRHYGWWPAEGGQPIYSQLYFAIISREEAAGLLDKVEKFNAQREGLHPVRAFIVDVEKMI